MQKGQQACEKAEDCLLAKMIQEADKQGAGMIPADALCGVLFTLQENFTDLQCHLGTILSVPSLGEPVGILCIGGQDGTCMRLMLKESEVAGLQKVLTQMQEALGSWATTKKNEQMY